MACAIALPKSEVLAVPPMSVTIRLADDPERAFRFSAHRHCAHCDIAYGDVVPNSFSFNSPVGACEQCRGFGRTIGIVGMGRIGYAMAKRCRGGWDMLVRYLKLKEGAVAVLPLTLIDHSGLSIRVGRGAWAEDPGGWDSGTVGAIYLTQRNEIGIGNR